MFSSSLSTFISVAALLSTLPLVNAHGIVSGVVIGGTEYAGFNPFQDPYLNPPNPDRVIRGGFDGNGPVRDPTSDAIQCNQNAKPSKLVAPAKAGDEVALTWTDWPSSHKGPVITYMAKAPEGTDITTWSPGTDAVWFKVDEAGFEDGKWAATDILTGEQNNVWKFNIPSELASGQYLIRHEIIALHAGFEGYPACVQIELEGPGTGNPSASDLVAFPGAYQPTDPGIAFSLNVPFTSYPIPGPAVFGSGSNTPDTPAPTTTAQPTVVPSSPASTVDVPVPTPSAEPEEPAPTTPTEPEAPEVPAPSTTPTTPAPTTAAPSTPKPTGGLKDAKVCMNEFNQCIAKTQPRPDWTGCGATRDACLADATYNANMLARAKRNGRYGRLLL